MKQRKMKCHKVGPTYSYVNSHNNRYWSTENPHVVHEVPLHNLKVGVWSEISAWRITGPVFFHKTLASEHYVRLILSSFFDQLAVEETSYCHLKEDNATATL